MPLKDDVLNIFIKNSGEIISGNDIALELNVSRNSVWKAVNQLRTQGYEILASTKSGYIFSENNDILSSDKITENLTTVELGRKITLFKTIDSTNTYAKSLASAGEVAGSVVISDAQTLGKGRMGKTFFSPFGTSIYMSVILRPKITVDRSLLITSCAAVAVARAIEKLCDVECKIKWVNDIYIGEKKVCGILTEASMDVEMSGLEYVVVGIGINVSNTDFPEEISEIATSLKLENAKKTSRNELIAEVLNNIEEMLPTLSERNFISEYKSRSNLINKQISIESGDTKFEALCVDIDDFGRLIVKLESGETKVVSSGTVRVIDKKILSI